MLLLRVFLLVMLIRGSSGQSGNSQPIPSVSLDHCKEMSCLVPAACTINQDGSDNKDSVELKRHDPNSLILPGCHSIVKIRSYSKKNYLFVLESHDQIFHTVELEYGAAEPRSDENKAKTTRITCHRNGDTVEVTLKKGDTERKLKSLGGSKVKPLKCEFFVKDQTDIFEVIDQDSDVVKLITPLTTYTYGGSDLLAYIKPTCDPDAVQTVNTGAVDDKTVSKVDVKLDELVCPTGQRMAFRKDQQSTFEAAPNGKITCEKASSTYQFKPTLIEARCEVTTCQQCNLNTLGSKGFETFDEGGCRKLKCKDDTRAKFGTSNPEDGIGECKYENNKHVWKLNGKTIEHSTDVKCAEKLKCFSSQEDVDKVCENCILGLNNLPVCKSETAVLKYGGSVKMDVQCDDITGKILFNSEPITLSKKLKCVDDKEEKAAEIAKKADEAAQQGTIIGASIGCVVGIAIIAGIVVFVVLRRKKQKAKKEEEEDEKKWKLKNALEQVKSGKSEKSWAKQHEELQRQQMNAPTEQMDEETRFGGDTGTKPTQKSSKKKRSKKDDTDPCYAGASAGPVIPHRDDDETGATGIDSVVIMPGPRKG